MVKRSDPKQMPKDDSVESLGTEAWNVADGYTKLKILRQLIQLDRFENIAIYGTEDMDSPTDLPYDLNKLNMRRAEALNRMLTTLQQLIGNVKFAIKKDNQWKVEVFIERLENIEEVIEDISEIDEDLVNHEIIIEINEEHFKNCLKILRQIKTDLNFPINEAGLIFKQSDEVDLEALMKDIVEGG